MIELYGIKGNSKLDKAENISYTGPEELHCTTTDRKGTAVTNIDESRVLAFFKYEKVLYFGLPLQPRATKQSRIEGSKNMDTLGYCFLRILIKEAKTKIVKCSQMSRPYREHLHFIFYKSKYASEFVWNSR